MKSSLRYLVAVPVLALTAIAAHAQGAAEGPWYGGFSAGQSRVKFDDSIAGVAGATASSLTKDETDTAFKLLAGYRFNPNFALEGGYTDFGNFKATRNVTAPAVGSLETRIKSSGFHFGLVGILPINDKFDFFGRIGAIRTSTETSYSTSGAVTLAAGANSNPKHSEWNGQYGIGVQLNVEKNIGVRLEYEVTKNVGDQNTGEGDIGFISAGVVVRF